MKKTRNIISFVLIAAMAIFSGVVFASDSDPEKDELKDYVPISYLEEDYNDIEEMDGEERNSLENIFPEAESIKGIVVYPTITDELYMIIIDNEEMGYYVITDDGKVEEYDESLHSSLFVQNVISETLQDKMQGLENSSSLDVYVIFYDLDHDEINEKFAETNPGIFSIEEKANNNVEVTIEEIRSLRESKREFYKQEYESYNSQYLNSLGVKSDKIMFSSHYSPMAILNLTIDEIYKLSENEDIYRLEYFEYEKGGVAAETATEVIQADYTRDEKYLDGTGVKIGQIELSVPDVTNSELDGASIVTRYAPSTNSEYKMHATRVAAIMVGDTIGLAPDATLYATSYTDSSTFYSEVEWLIDQGVDVINMSADIGGATNTYDIYSQWMDHLAITHSVHFVIAAGNRNGSDSPYFGVPAMGYNIVTVGGFDDNDSTDVDYHAYYTSSSYIENLGAPEKPDIIAPAEDIEFPNSLSYLGETVDSGTSYACPLVTGTIAQMIDYEPTLATQQTSMKAILAASAYKKVEPSHYGVGISGTQYYDDIEGAGEVDAKNARYVIKNDRYWRGQVDLSDFPYEKTFYASSSSSQIRVALFWLKQNSISGDHTDQNNLTQTPLTNLSLVVKDPNGNTVATSTMYYNNVEVVEFDPTISGTYTIRVVRVSGTAGSEWIGLAWW